MSKEDREFLEKVMAEGIIDENERMKFILQEATKAMEYYRTKSKDSSPPSQSSDPPISDEDLEDLLQELQDIVEQIDYARAFCSLQGLPFLIGCIVMEQNTIPDNIRMTCGGILSTVCQNNPPVQKQLLELGVIKSLSGPCTVHEPRRHVGSRCILFFSSSSKSSHFLLLLLRCIFPDGHDHEDEGKNHASH